MQRVTSLQLALTQPLPEGEGPEKKDAEAQSRP
jgi:hypothetical protein